MTEHIYDRDAYIREFDATVAECVSTVYSGRELYAVTLDATAFFPEQGGQDSDTGFLRFGDSETEVIHVSIKNDIITHICSSAVPAGTRIHGCIDWDARYDRMQQHSGEHLVSGFVHEHFGYDNVGFHLGDSEVTLDFNGTFTDEELELTEDTVNRHIWENIPSVITFPSAAELELIPYRSKKELTGQVRIVEFPGCDICACCAPHVACTGEIGQIKLVRAEHFRGGTRIWIACGRRALIYHRQLLSECTAVSRQLSSGVTEIASAVRKLGDNYDALHVRTNMIETELMFFKADRAVSDGEAFFTVAYANPDIAREAVNRMTASAPGYHGVFIGDDDHGYRFIIGSSDLDCRALIPLLRSQQAKGGGSERMIQGNSPVRPRLEQ